MSPEILQQKVEELRAAVVSKLEELEEDANWGTAEEREDLAQAIEELLLQLESLRDRLQEDL
jgi:hypothetical protein